MKSLTRTHLETVIYKLFILCEGGATQNLVATITGIIEKRMSLTEHVHSNLMCPSCLKHTFHESDISESLQNFIMCDSMFADCWVIKNSHLQLIPGITGYISDYRALISVEITPH